MVVFHNVCALSKNQLFHREFQLLSHLVKTKIISWLIFYFDDLPDTDDGGGFPSMNILWWDFDGAASRASIATHSFFALNYSNEILK
jgi:hypothetical protein